MYTTTLPCGTRYASVALANGDLATRAINSTFACYYDSANVGNVLLSKYDVAGFFASYVTFYVLAGICVLVVAVLLFAYFISHRGMAESYPLELLP